MKASTVQCFNSTDGILSVTGNIFVEVDQTLGSPMVAFVNSHCMIIELNVESIEICNSVPFRCSRRYGKMWVMIETLGG